MGLKHTNIMDTGIRYSTINLFPFPSCETNLSFRCVCFEGVRKKTLDTQNTSFSKGKKIYNDRPPQSNDVFRTF